MLLHTLKLFSQALAFKPQLTTEYKMHQSQKCGLFPTVDKRHLQAGISQEYQAEIKAESNRNMLNDIGVWLIIATFQASLAYLILFA